MATSVRVIPLHAVATVATVRPLPHASIAKSRSLFGAASPVRPFVSTSFRLEHGSHSQLESSPSVSQNHLTPATPQTLTEKIVQQYAVGLPRGKKVRAGDYVTLAPQHVMTHDNSHPVAMKFMEMGGTKVYNNRQLVTCIDHDTQNKTEPYIKKIRQIQEFAAKHDIPFYPPGRGIGHQIMVEEGYAWPGTVAVASDSHSNIYGGVACLGTPVVRTDAASIWATGQTWWQHPPVAKITFTGILPPGVSGKDVIVALCGLFNQDEVLNHAIEFAGSEQTMASIPIGDRLTIANMTTEWGALSGLFPVDETLVSWYRAKATTAAILDNATQHRINHERIDKIAENRLNADPGAVYAKEFYLSLSTLSPFVAGPNSVKIATPVMKLEAENIPINKAYNARASDFARAARVFREAAQDNKPAKIAPGVDLYIAAASTVEQEVAEEAGDWQLLLDAGAQPLPSGCGPCIGLGTGLLEPGEVGISASNRNFKGRMGSTDAKAYLASPEIVAASALHGRISGPGWYQKPEGIEKVIIGEGSGDLIADQAVAVGDALQNFINQAENLMATSEWADRQSSLSVPVENETLTDIFPGFPEKIEGEIVFCDNDNINTDGIYPGKYTYNDVTTEKMAAVCMENYDLEFRTTAKSGDILVAGYCFGVGSSREQAATAILAKQIPLVVAGSFSNIFGRNSINNALPVLESPRLVQRLREIYKHEAKKMLTRRTGWKLLWDVRRSKIIVTENDGSIWEEKVSEIPATVQEVMAKGGLEKWVKSKIENSE